MPSIRTLLGFTNKLLWVIALKSIAVFSANSYAQDGALLAIELKSDIWAQFVVPGDPAEETIESLFGNALEPADYGKTWIVFTYDSNARRYVNPGIDGSLRQAQAFWITQQTGASVSLSFQPNIANAQVVQSDACSSADGCAEVPLATGSDGFSWTLTGLPFRGVLPTEQFSILTSSDDSSCSAGCSLDKAATSRYTDGAIWVYDSESEGYVDQTTQGDLKPYQGFWIATLPEAESTNPVLLLPSTGSPPDDPKIPELPGQPQVYTYPGTQILVNNVSELQGAIADATAGDVITLSRGIYLAANRITLAADGTASRPITLRAANVRETEINFSQDSGIVEGFVVRGKHWVIDGLVLSSDCDAAQHSRCEHAIHVKSNAEGLKIRNNRLVDFNAAIKGGGSDNIYANNVHIEHNEIFNTTTRMTSNPVTPIDINGGDSWLISKNWIYDFVKGAGNQVSYGAFLKANSSNGVMDSNLVQCQKEIAAPGARIGLSFGGGGNSPIDSPICKDSDCSQLHRNGRMTNNVITNCSDVGIYINASSDTLLDHNTLFSTAGIDIRFSTSTARVVTNILVGGDISERQGGQVTQNEANALKSAAEVPSFADLENAIVPHSLTDPQLSYDICGYPRSTPLIGAIGGSSQQQSTCLSDLFDL